MKIRVGIVGYGNLGKAVESEILKNTKFKLVAIFSRRNIVSKFNTIIEPYDNFVLYKGKIDIMFMCGGSANDIEYQIFEISKYFHTINTFDTHSKLQKLVKDIDKVNKANKTISLSACGWDPGLFSIIRSYFYAISGEKPVTFWGKGISMGHSDAIRRIEGVLDAVQFTVPNKKAVIKAKKGALNDVDALHNRECYIFSNEKDKSRIENEIKNIPNYFKGQPTSVCFVSGEKIAFLKRKMAHKGTIISTFRLFKSKKASFEFKAKMDSNPMFTAKIMVKFSFAIINLQKERIFGAFLPIDIAPVMLFGQKEKDFLIKHLC